MNKTRRAMVVLVAGALLAVVGVFSAERIPGFRVSDTIVPYYDTDTYPTHEARFGKGGLRTVADTNARNAILTTYREPGMMVFVTNQAKFYRLGQDLMTWTEFTASGGTNGVTDGDKGDITVSGDIWSIDTSAVTTDKLSVMTSADLAGKVSDETGSGALVFAGGALGAATATSPSADDDDTSVATTEWVQDELQVLSGDWITSGTVGDARIASTIMRDNEGVLLVGGTMTGDLSVPNEAYGVGWNGSVEVPTKDAVYDKIESLVLSGGGAVDSVFGRTGVVMAVAYDYSADQIGVAFSPTNYTATATNVLAHLMGLDNQLEATFANFISTLGGTMTGDLIVPDDAYDATSWNGNNEVPTKNAIRDKIESLCGGGTAVFVDGATVSNPNLLSNWRTRRAVAAATNVIDLPPLPVTASGNSFTPNFAAATFFDYELTGATTVNAPSNVDTNMIGAEFLLQLTQDSTGNRTATFATNYMGSLTLPMPVTLSTNGVDILRFLVVRSDVFRLTMHHSGYAK